MKRSLGIAILLVLAHSPAAATVGAATTNEFENLTLDQATELAERLHPDLAEARALVDAAAGRVQQAGTFPNPEAILGAQQLPLDSGASNQKEYVAGIAQPIPLRGRLGKARAAELLEREFRARGLEVTRLELRKRVHGAFATALYQEKAFQTQGQIEENAAKAVATTRARVEAGDTPAEELARAEMELGRAKLELQRSASMREQSMVALAAAIGDTSLRFKSLSGNLDATFEIPTLETLAAGLSAQPEVQLAEAGLLASQARVNLARAEQIPDVKVEALYHRLEATKENTFDIGLSMPLPLFNRNRGRVREARAEVAAAEARARGTQNELGLRSRESHAQLTSALAGSRMLKTEILPRADALLRAAEARYAAGDISLNEVLPVRRDWAAVQLIYLESLRDVMRAWTDLSPFLSRPLTKVQ